MSIWLKILVTIGLSFISGLLYHLGGGAEKGYNTKWRDWGCSLIALICLWLLKGLNFAFWWGYIAFFLLSWGALSTYWKKGVDAKAINWFFHGFGCGLATIPFYWLGIHWWAILVRTVILGLTMMWWSENNDDVFWEEGGRGTLIILTLPILLI